jgi:hypothetical protein
LSGAASSCDERTKKQAADPGGGFPWGRNVHIRHSLVEIILFPDQP